MSSDAPKLIGSGSEARLGVAVGGYDLVRFRVYLESGRRRLRVHNLFDADDDIYSHSLLFFRCQAGYPVT